MSIIPEIHMHAYERRHAIYNYSVDAVVVAYIFKQRNFYIYTFVFIEGSAAAATAPRVCLQRHFILYKKK